MMKWYVCTLSFVVSFHSFIHLCGMSQTNLQRPLELLLSDLEKAKDALGQADKAGHADWLIRSTQLRQELDVCRYDFCDIALFVSPLSCACQPICQFLRKSLENSHTQVKSALAAHEAFERIGSVVEQQNQQLLQPVKQVQNVLGLRICSVFFCLRFSHWCLLLV